MVDRDEKFFFGKQAFDDNVVLNGKGSDGDGNRASHKSTNFKLVGNFYGFQTIEDNDDRVFHGYYDDI